MPNLRDCLTQATRYWETKRDGDTMVRRARTCALLLGMSRDARKLTPADAIQVLAGLKRNRLSSSSQASYYAAFRRMLALNGVATVDWPAGPVPPRRTREPLSGDDLGRLIGELVEAGDDETAHLALLLRGTGMRVDGEALSFDAWAWDPERKLLRITGKGGHERVIPVQDPGAVAILSAPAAVNALRRVSYRTHSRKWKAAAERAGITSKLPTPHAVRHFYATEAYRKCRDIRVVQDLLGHADYATTARYIGVDTERMRAAL